MQTLLTETAKMLSILNDNNLRDAGLIASAQKLEHYEIAAYGTAAALAGQLDLHDEQGMLHESLEEEKEADALLTMLAKGGMNQDAIVVGP
jgi:ferritin-like metal-binding protein YciE